MQRSLQLFGLVLTLLMPTSVLAQLTLPRVFSDGAVLQREVDLPVWGKASAGAEVTVTVRGIQVSAIADDDGHWRAVLPPLQAGGPYPMTVESPEDTVTFSEVYVGDVWLASGQSNMEFILRDATGGAEAIAAADDPAIRHFKVPKALANNPRGSLPASSAWQPSTSSYVGNHSAVAYFFARRLRAETGVPIGILNVSYGGSRIETWMSDAMLGYDEQTVELANGEPERQPTVAFNAMLYPLIGLPVKGFLWYQGESNADTKEDALAYEEQFRILIHGWRDLWGFGDLPFLWVQLPNFGTPSGSSPATWDAWPQLRKGQDAALQLPATGQAITIDVGDEDIHPPVKEPVGTRLALVALKVAYRQDIVYSGPRYLSNSLDESGAVHLRFNHVDGGLIGAEDGSVGAVAIAGSDERFVWADALIEGDEVVVSEATIPEPMWVRYAWEYNPVDANLYNAEGLPAAPFEALVYPGFKLGSFKAARTVIEEGQSTSLSWVVYGASSVTLDGEPVDSAGTRFVSPDTTTVYMLEAVSREDPAETFSETVTLEVLDPALVNRTAGHPATASTIEACCGGILTADLAVDGDLDTRWSSAWSDGSLGTTADPNLDNDPDDEWIAVDMGSVIDIERVILTWEAAYGSAYDIELSYDGYIWISVFEERAGDGGEDIIRFDTPVTGRYLRVHGHERATQYGYSLWEVAAYGSISAVIPPSVTVGTAAGDVVDVGAGSTLVADAADGDGTVTSVEFFVDAVSVGVASSSPFELGWVPPSADVFELTAIATDDSGIAVRSDPVSVYAVSLETMTRYEAESAQTTGQAASRNSGGTSGGKFVELRDAWTITWSDVMAPENGRFLLSIGYQLTFDSPKTQYLVVNGDTLEALEFTAPNTSGWFRRGVEIPLRGGRNEIAFHGFWNWMSFDYIEISVEALNVGLEDRTSEQPDGYGLGQNFPNPFRDKTTISYRLERPDHVRLEIFDVEGRRVASLVDGRQPAGAFNVEFDSGGLAPGVYLYRLHSRSTVETRHMILVR